MNILRLFGRRRSATTARDRLQVLLAHERAAVGGTDLVGILREEIMDVLARHVAMDGRRVKVTVERGAQVSTLAVDIEIPYDTGVRAA
ncbi:cell division topological specificity factor MinE [Oricola sp.]|uniref:cell division topological specificity factor MinE n=1 Tax=Oricola sp. TaxID=1979950 RepID=UPI003BACC55A